MRIAAGLVMLLWLAALSAPYQVSTWYGQPPQSGGRGYVLAALGWLGPLQFSIAWFANIPLAFAVLRMGTGRQPGARSAMLAAVMAASCLLPHFVFDFERDGRLHSEIIFGWAVWLWLGAFAIVLGVARRRQAGVNRPAG